MKTLACLTLALATAALAACGGGSDSASSPSTPVQNPPATGGNTGTGGGTTPPANTAVTINGVFSGAGTVLGASQDVVVAYQNGLVTLFAGTTGTNVQSTNIYGRAGITNAGGVTRSNQSAPINSFFLPNGTTSFLPYGGSYVTTNGNVTSVNAFSTTETGVKLNASSLNRSSQYIQTSLTRLPAGTYRARVNTTGETANMVVTTGGSFSLTTGNNCSISGTSAAPATSGTPGVTVNMDASFQCFPGSTAGANMFGPGLVGTGNARLLIGGNDTRGVTGLAISAELVSADSTPQAPAFPTKAVGLFESENGQRVMLIDESDNITFMLTEPSNPSLYTSIAVGKIRNGGSPIPPGNGTNFFRDSLTGSLTAFSRGARFTGQATGQFLANRNDVTNLQTELSVPNSADTTKSFAARDLFRPSSNGRAYTYDRMARVSEVVGRYSTREFAGGPVHNFSIASNGALTGTLGTCQMTGQLTARNKNIFDVTVTFGNASQGCSNTRVANQNVLGQTYRGISYGFGSGGQDFTFFALFDSANGVGYGVRMTRCGASSDLCQ